MSENVRSQKWLVISFFLVCTLIFGYFVYLIAFGSPDPRYSNWMSGARSSPGAPVRPAEVTRDGPIVMVKDRQINLEDVQLTYRGLTSGLLQLDLVLLEMDPHYTYRRRIPLQEARRGFQVSYQHLKVVSASRQQLKLVRISPSH